MARLREQEKSGKIALNVERPTVIKPEISVIICTHNPNLELLECTLECLRKQDFDGAWEVILVDNKSDNEVNPTKIFAGFPAECKLVVEPRLGLTFARCRGIQTAQANVLCFVDDDNMLEPSYLLSAIKVANAEAALGVWGGKALPELKVKPSKLVEYYLPFFGIRDVGERALTGSGAAWGEWEPIGAGMVVRREVAESFVQFVEDTDDACGLGRAGNSLLSGEDSLFSRIAARLGFSVGYRPELSLVHVMPRERLNVWYLMRMLKGHGRTHFVLEQIAGQAEHPVCDIGNVDLIKRFLHRMKSPGLMEAIGHLWWDLGYRDQRKEAEKDTKYLRAAKALAAVERRR